MAYSLVRKTPIVKPNYGDYQRGRSQTWNLDGDACVGCPNQLSGMDCGYCLVGLGDLETEKTAGVAFIWNVTAESRGKFQYGDRIHENDVNNIISAIANYMAGRTGYNPGSHGAVAFATFWDWISPKNQSEWYKNKGYRISPESLNRAGVHIAEVIWQIIGQPGYVGPEQAKALARRMFLKYLHRPIVEGQELENWKTEIMTYRLTEVDIANRLKATVEHRQMLERDIWPIINRVFSGLLGITPNQAQLDMESNNIIENQWDEDSYKKVIWTNPLCLTYMTNKFYKIWIIKAFRKWLGRTPNTAELENESKNIHTNIWTESQYNEALSGNQESKDYIAAQAAAAAAAQAAAAAAEAARKAAEEAARKQTGTTQAGFTDIFKNKWTLIALAAAGFAYYWTQVRHKALGTLPGVQYIQKIGGKK